MLSRRWGMSNFLARQSRRRLIVLVLAGVALLALAWQILVITLAGILDTPSLAIVRLNGGNADALIKLADQRMIETDGPAAQTLATRALSINPIEGKAALIMALAAASNGHTPQADALMMLADKLTRRQRLAEAWLFDLAMTNGHYPLAFQHADAALRVNGSMEEKLMPVLVQVTAFAPALPALADRLAMAPPWRGDFFAALGNDTGKSDAAALLAALSHTKAPASPQEVSLLIAAQVKHGNNASAKQLARASLGHDLPMLADGSFDAAGPAGPFGWEIPQGKTGFAEITARTDGRGKALRVQAADHGKPVALARQVLVLDPRGYRLSGSVMGKGTTGVALRLTCAGGKPVLIQMAPTVTAAWQPFATNFVVPAQACQSQQLEILSLGTASDDSEAWFDDFRLEPLPG